MPTQDFLSSVEITLNALYRPPEKSFDYGTAGFRCDSDDLPQLMYRMGVFTTIRSYVCNKIIGVMITASHNPSHDNGIKIVDFDGGMLDGKWEKMATDFANCTTASFAFKVQAALDGLNKTESSPRIYIACDTRPSSERLKRLVYASATASGATVCDFGNLTTGQIHWIVREANLGNPCQESDYFDNLAQGYIKMIYNVQDFEIGDLVIDGANGVGAIKLEQLDQVFHACPKLKVINKGEGELNHFCGSDHVQRSRRFPVGFDGETSPFRRMCSIDGDCDRVVYFTSSSKDQSLLLADGDRIACLFASYVCFLIQQIGESDSLTIGLVQTAYANGSSVQHIERNKKIRRVLSPTGVKNLHKLANSFDVGIYFEANGHGTVLFGEKFKDYLRSKKTQFCDAASNQKAITALIRLEGFAQLMNQATGDAISDILAVEAILRSGFVSFEGWMEMYRELPSRLMTVKVANRSSITTTQDETRVLQPDGLQEEIDQVVAKYPAARCFVRPSGTEDVARIYAEAQNMLDVDNILERVIQIVKSTC